MLPDRREAAGCKRERKPPQRLELVPLFGWISEDPLDRACVIIDADEKIFPARNNNRVIRPIVSHGVVMEPVVWRLVNKLTRIIASGPHGRADNSGQVPSLQNPARSVHLNVYRLREGCGIRVQDNSNFATVDIVMEKSDPETAVIANLGDGAVEIDSIQAGTMSQINSIIKKASRITRKPSRANPSQRTVRVDDGGREIAACSLNHDVVVA